MAKATYSFICPNIILVLVLLLQCAECQFIRRLGSPCGNAGKYCVSTSNTDMTVCVLYSLL